MEPKNLDCMGQKDPWVTTDDIFHGISWVNITDIFHGISWGYSSFFGKSHLRDSQKDMYKRWKKKSITLNPGLSSQSQPPHRLPKEPGWDKMTLTKNPHQKDQLRPVNLTFKDRLKVAQCTSQGHWATGLKSVGDAARPGQAQWGEEWDKAVCLHQGTCLENGRSVKELCRDGEDWGW